MKDSSVQQHENINTSFQYVILTTILAIGIFFCMYVEWNANKVNGGFGFPLDDPWIHLQFAKNLHDYGSFSYYKNQMVTSGSTSPLYTLLLGAGFFVTGNEMLLSYFLGLSFFALAAIYLYKLILLDINNSVLFASAGVWFLFFEPRLEWIALSGMETTLFISLLVASTYYYRRRKSIALGLFAGLLIWTRPEALIFLAVLAIDALYEAFVVRAVKFKNKIEKTNAASLTWLRNSILIIVIFVLVYIGFNMVLSGSIFPNTFAAKIKYYSHASRNFLEDVYHFLSDDHQVVLKFFILIGTVSCLVQLMRRRHSSVLVPLLWSLLLTGAYSMKLPYLYQEGRYLMPLLPFTILIGLSGLNVSIQTAGRFVRKLATREGTLIVSSILLFMIAFQYTTSAWDKRNNYTEYCKYISDRQVRTARWLHDNVPENAIIATHDIGAIAFYSRRQIADMVGLVSPEMIDNIGDLNKLRQFLQRKRVTHLAVLRNWFEVANQPSLFQTDERFPEIMEVFPFNPEKVHFVPQGISRMTDEAEYNLSAGNVQQAGRMLEQAVRLDPQYSKAHCLLAAALLAIGKIENAEHEFETAVQLSPSYWDAHIGLAEVAARRNQPQEAISRLESIIKQSPTHANTYSVLAHVYQTFHIDSVKAKSYQQRYDELIQETVQ